jgi:hypothetical protein
VASWAAPGLEKMNKQAGREVTTLSSLIWMGPPALGTIVAVG